MQELLDYRQQLLVRCAAVADDLRQAAQSLPPAGWHSAALPNQPSPHQALARFNAIETQLLQPSLEILLNEEDSLLPVFSTRDWLQTDYRPDEPWAALLESCLAAHAEMLKPLQALPPARWSVAARHPWHGVRTLQWWVEQGLCYAEEALQMMIIQN
ncbi:MAG: hypothetical protein OEZ02_00045 [Anaerolineae bacterium]|nr:hypothetical protein [Anaerolineae bacterium]